MNQKALVNIDNLIKIIMKIGIAADHGGFELKQVIHEFILSLNHEVIDFGAYQLDRLDDYPDTVLPLAKAVSTKQVKRGIAICGSGVGATVVANKIRSEERRVGKECRSGW